MFLGKAVVGVEIGSFEFGQRTHGLDRVTSAVLFVFFLDQLNQNFGRLEGHLPQTSVGRTYQFRLLPLLGAQFVGVQVNPDQFFHTPFFRFHFNNKILNK